jgi:hypothetical protein
MTSAPASAHVTLALVLAIAAVPFFPGSLTETSAQSGAVALASHRAVYDLKLAQTRGKRPMSAVRGRILYDFSGSACEGYALQFRQVSELDSGEGKVAVSDLRATTWEEGEAKRLRFHSENYMDEKLRDTVDGEAQRVPDGIGIKLTKPSDKSVDLKNELLFPTEHVRRIIAAAKAGQSLLQAVVYDGSESGEKLYDTLTVIGHPIAPDGKKPDDAASNQNALAQMTRWPVTISYFDKSAQNGEQTPIYAITFELYENGISRALLLDYGDFVVSGEMTSLEIKDVRACP